MHTDKYKIQIMGIAMDSGSEEIKCMADYVTNDIENGGIYKAFSINLSIVIV